MSTFLQLRNRCAERFGDPDKLKVTDSLWKAYLNDRYRRVMAHTEQWPFLETQGTVSVSAAARSGTLPTGVYAVTAVWNSTDQVKMEPIDSYSAYRAAFPADDEAGTPVLYRVVDDDLWVWPKPTATTSIKIDYRVAEADMSGDSDVPVLPAQFQPILVSGALSDAYMDGGEPGLAAVHEGAWDRQLATMHHELLSSRTEHYPQIVDDFWG